MDSKRMLGVLSRDLFVLEDEDNPRRSEANQIMPSTILDQVFDDQDPTKKNLRKILEELRQDILTGGRGNIVFPVTTVNGKEGDVVLSKVDLGLGRVDNTSDVDKPLSVPQKTAIMEILKNYDFNVNLDEVYDHMRDINNPHQVTLDQLNLDNELETYVETLISKHDISTSSHMNIRQSLSTLWVLVDGINNSIEDRLHNILLALENHIDDEYAHVNLLDPKENVSNKVTSFFNEEDINHIKYPTTQSVVEYISRYVEDFRETLPGVVDWIDDIVVVDSRSDIPAPSEKYHRKAYFIRYGNSSHCEIAVCRHNTYDDTYSWDYSYLGSYSKFNSSHFVDSPDGLSINMSSVVDAILSDNGALDTSLSEVLKDYYTSEEIDSMHLINDIKIIPGTQDGTIRYYTNDDMTTMSEDIKVSGLKRIAYLEWITENELKDNAVRSKHIIDNAVETRHIQDQSITIDKFGCGTCGTVLGNMIYTDEQKIHEIKLVELADYLRPLIGGWPDPSTPGGNPWYEALCDQIAHPHVMTPNIEYDLSDKSYIMRFTGTISSVPNMMIKTELSTDLKLGKYRIIDAGGSWCYQSDPEEWTILGGSNITGHTFATVNMTTTGTYLETISIGDRLNATYDVWVKYIKPDELKD